MWQNMAKVVPQDGRLTPFRHIFVHVVSFNVGLGFQQDSPITHMISNFPRILTQVLQLQFRELFNAVFITVAVPCPI